MGQKPTFRKGQLPDYKQSLNGQFGGRSDRLETRKLPQKMADQPATVV
jgi:hypothetical protein